MREKELEREYEKEKKREERERKRVQDILEAEWILYRKILEWFSLEIWSRELPLNIILGGQIN